MQGYVISIQIESTPDMATSELTLFAVRQPLVGRWRQQASPRTGSSAVSLPAAAWKRLEQGSSLAATNGSAFLAMSTLQLCSPHYSKLPILSQSRYVGSPTS
ncbi:hypothetical protein TMEN_3952 [Trichophyton mentagrophytes]|nr:hypothetical protein TMEN_3952 [Trichophyton mentagrophytes]